MGWRATGDVTEFLAVADGYLRAERARNTVLLTVAETLRQGPGRYDDDGGAAAGASTGASTDADAGERPLLGWWAETGETGAAGLIGGAFVHTPPFPVVLSAVPPAVAAELATGPLAGRRLSGINAYPEAATAFAAAWRDAAGGRTDVHLRMRLYRLDRLAWPDRPCAGGPRVAAAADTGLLERWFAAFESEANDRVLTRAAAAVRERLGYDGITLWEAAGRPVSMAGVSRKVAGMVRVGSVYTPPELRGRGYASAVTAAASQRALDAGADEVLLYTDLTNPVSNSIYQHIGYRPVEDRLELTFSGP